jgi:hypothetical protein
MLFAISLGADLVQVSVPTVTSGHVVAVYPLRLVWQEREEGLLVSTDVQGTCPV